MVLGLCSCVLVMMSRVWLGFGFRVFFFILLEIDYREEHKEHEDVLLKKIMKKKKKKIRKTFN